MSFVGRFVLFQSILYRRFHCILNCANPELIKHYLHYNTENIFQRNIKTQQITTTQHHHTLDSTTAISGHVIAICPPAAPHGVRVSLERVDVVEVSLPVLDQATVVRGDHPHVVVAPHHTADRAVMTLNRAHHTNSLLVMHSGSEEYLSCMWLKQGFI